MSRTATVIGSKTLPATVSLHASSISPIHPLVALASPSTSSESKVSLHRIGASFDLVWEWNNVGEPVKPAAGGLGGLKGKAKAAPVGKIEQLAWSTQGSFIAVAISPATPSSPSTLAILSVHDGKPLSAPPLPLPTSAKVSHLSWHALDYSVDRDLTSWSIDLIRRLPGLPRIVKEGAAGSGHGPGGGGTGTGPALGNFAANPGGGGGGGGGGVFGAKQAMLERERAKEAQRALNLRESAPSGFPTLLIDRRPDQFEGTGDENVKAMLRTRSLEHDETEKTVLCVGDEDGKLHLYLGGSVFLGSIDVGDTGNAIIQIRVLPPTSSSAIRFLIHLSSNLQLYSRQLALPVPSSIQLVIRQSSAIRATIQHAFEALQEVRNLWDESRRIGKGWLQRVADVSRPQGVVLPPVTQLHMLLMTGRPTRSLHDFLASKMNERGLVKWEQEMGVALDRMKRVGWMSIVPAMERAILLLLEVDAWSRWPAKFGTYKIDRNTVLKAVEVAKGAIRQTARLQTVVEEEERCFKAFVVWLHYELDKLAQQEGSEVRPNAAFHPIPVSSYLQSSLSPQTSPVNPFLAMGLASLAIPQNPAIANGQKWLDRLQIGQTEDGGSKETLEVVVKRLREELIGQSQREHLPDLTQSRAGPIDSEVFTIEPPFAHSASAVDEPRPIPASRPSDDEPAPESISVLLHLLGQLAGEVTSKAVTQVGRQSQLQAPIRLGQVRGEEEGGIGSKSRRVRSIVSNGEQLHEAWIANSTLHVTRHRVDAPELREQTAFKLENNGHPIKIFDIELVEPGQLVLALEVPGSAGLKQYTNSLDLSSLSFSTQQLPADLPPLPLDRSVVLDSTLPPSHIAIAAQDSRLFACTLAGEGRRLEIHDCLGSTNDEMDLQ